MSFVWLNGSFIDASTASISLRDPGLLHGAGIFTTMRAYGGLVFRLGQHLARLRESGKVLGLPFEFQDDALLAAVEELLQKNALQDARLRLTATASNIFWTAAPLEAYPAEFYERGMTAVIVDDQKLNPYDRTAGHKTLNYFSRLAALREANKLHAGEALWFDVHHYLQSGSVSNVLMVKNDELMTPTTNQEMPQPQTERSCVLPGITRATVIEIARSTGLPVRTTPLDLGALLDADEVFLTNSIMQVMPVCRIERKAIGADKPGPITLMLRDRLAQLIKHEVWRAMGKARSEAFSDGVFAIAITLLILEIRVPHEEGIGSERELTKALLYLWPSYFAFATSFATILIMWVNHHGLFALLQRVDARFLFANGMLLLMVTFIPFPTALFAQHITGPASRPAAIFYCGSFVLTSLAYNALLYSARSRPGLLRDDIPAKHLSKITRAYRFGFAAYTIATLVALVHPLSGALITSLLWILWMRLDYSVHSTAHDRAVDS